MPNDTAATKASASSDNIRYFIHVVVLAKASVRSPRQLFVFIREIKSFLYQSSRKNTFYLYLKNQTAVLDTCLNARYIL